ncbi:MAG: Crp/Fnr family transcriptional regulator [Actinobacteria bacterium]|nr:Crp/Fnr family transcriptional regulator [Actinomycetota bacterium]
MALATMRTVAAREIIFFQGEPAVSAYYLANGSVRIFRIDPWGKECTVFARKAGEMFGLAEVVGMGEKERRSTAQALNTCCLYEIAKANLDLLLSHHYTLTSRVMDVLGRRIRYLCEQVENLMVCDVTTRLLKVLVYLSYPALAEHYSQNEPVTIPVRLTQEHLAGMIGSCQQTVSEILSRLTQEGVIRVDRKGITLLRPAETLSSMET